MEDVVRACLVSGWGEWTNCTSSCGGGTRMRNRTVTQQCSCGGTGCPILDETEECNIDPCPPPSSPPLSPPISPPPSPAPADPPKSPPPGDASYPSLPPYAPGERPEGSRLKLSGGHGTLIFGSASSLAPASEYIRRTGRGTLVIEAAEEVIIQGERFPQRGIDRARRLADADAPRGAISSASRGSDGSSVPVDVPIFAPDVVVGGSSMLELRSHVHALMMALTEERRTTYRMQQELTELKARVAVIESGEKAL